MRIILSIVVAVWAMAAGAEPVRYLLNGAASQVEFTFDVEGLKITGQVPVKQADIRIDVVNVGRSSVVVDMDTAAARTGNPLATDAMKGGSVLNTAQFPQARFRSTRIVRNGDQARLSGDLTLRGVTRPVTLDGGIFRERGSAAGDLSSLVLLFTGVLDRNAFGASGFPQLVAPDVTLRIVVAIERAP